MPLTPSDAQWLLNRLQSHSATKRCPDCGGGNWTLQNMLGFISTIEMNADGSNVDPGAGYPVAIMACNQCAHVKMYSVNQLGFTPGVGGGEKN